MIATEKKMTTLKDFAAHFRPNTALNVVIDSLNQAWRRAQIGGNLSLGKFDRNRDDLNTTEIDFALDWFKANSDEAAPSVQTPDATHQNDILALQRDKKALLGEKTTLIAAYNAERSAKETALKTVVELENEGKILRGQIASLNAQIERVDKSAASGLNSQTAILDRQIVSLETKLAKAESKLEAAADSERKRADAAKIAHDAELDEEKQARVDAMDAYEKRLSLNNTDWEAKHGDTITLLDSLATGWNQERRMLEAQIAKLTAKRKWRDWLPKSLYDVVNVTSNLFALAGFVLLFKWVGVLAFIITACTFYAIVQDAKKTAGGWLTFFGVIGAVAIELYYSYSHLNLFQKLLAGQKYPFDVSADNIGLAFTILISGGSVYAVAMTALRSVANAEAERIAEIDANLTKTTNNQ